MFRRIDRQSISLYFCFLFGLLLCVLVPLSQAAETDPKVVIIEFHGLKQNIIRDNLSELPNFRELIEGGNGDQVYVHLSRVMTTIPAASVPACTAMYTGLTPQKTGVVSTIWFDRQKLQTRTMISYGQQRINNELKDHGVSTIFDYVSAAGKQSLNCMLIVNKGADWTINSSPFFWGNAAVIGFFKNGRLFPHKTYTDPKTFSAFIDGHVLAGHKSIKGLYKRYGDVPDLMVIQLLGMDLDSHFPEKRFVKHNAYIDKIQKDYVKTILDPQIGPLIQVFKDIGVYDSTIFILVSQQGAVKIDKRIDDYVLNRVLQTAFNLADASTVNRVADAIVMPGASTKEVYLKNRSTRNWEDAPRLIADVKPAVDLILNEPQIIDALNALVIRQCPEGRDEGVPETDQWWHLQWDAYIGTKRTDQAFKDALQPIEDMARRFELESLVVEGLNRQYTRPTAPDIKLINKKGAYFLRRMDKYGHHGSYYPEDLILSFWVTGPGLANVFKQRHIIDHTASTLDLVPMACHLMGIPIPAGLDGKNPLAHLN